MDYDPARHARLIAYGRNSSNDYYQESSDDEDDRNPFHQPLYGHSIAQVHRHLYPATSRAYCTTIVLIISPKHISYVKPPNIDPQHSQARELFDDRYADECEYSSDEESDAGEGSESDGSTVSFNESCSEHSKGHRVLQRMVRNYYELCRTRLYLYTTSTVFITSGSLGRSCVILPPPLTCHRCERSYLVLPHPVTCDSIMINQYIRHTNKDH